MKHCCEDKSTELAALRVRQGKVLKVVLFLNALMFVVELISGIVARSVSLKADSLDMLGDAFVYGFSLYVIDRSQRERAKAALLKGIIMALFGVWVLGEAVLKAFSDVLPQHETMGLVGFMALSVNAYCLYLLTRHKGDDLNMRSTWLCSRNDIIANTSVLLAALLVGATASKIPDLAVGTMISILFLSSALSVLRDARTELTIENSHRAS